MLTFYKKFGRSFFDIILIGLTFLVGAFLFQQFISITAPICIAIVLYYILNPITTFFQKRGLKRWVASLFTTTIFCATMLAVLFTFGLALFAEVQSVINALPKYTKQAEELIINGVEYIQNQVENLPPETFESIKSYISTFLGQGSNYVTSFFLGLLTAFASFSKVVFNVFLGIILFFFLSIDHEEWISFLKKSTPKTFKKAFSFMKNNVIRGLGAYVKAQLILVTFTFLIVYIAFTILEVDNALSMALFAAVLDLLPVVGMPLLFLPWGVYSYFTGGELFAFSLAGLWIFIFIFRQILEPKIAGDSLGVSSFTMLSSMVISITVFGVIGLLLTPIFIVTIKALYEEKLLSKWIHAPKDEYES
ncbi:sporulation integral membrane protein YtvI (plasmid) [Pontibacillus sp. ALD_SL1]|uniref:sporulation integral membrane protein YtvI n=1 Tax=Pontibacillus sp. ALD_SL1 TaxID=2777185 RepID=UPI001A965754|nr:sporulation integral membrane protein YtvI [Pontibacillus sp. ALD_SL1]QST02047.1 sporulation integral membrane protein YtvI [Pontibacillus sp. ALD_SL1]